MKINPAEKHSRSLVKAISYRVISITADSIAAFLFTQSAAMTFGIVAVVNGYSMVLYFLHERLWANIQWGRIERKP
jgi:uncharacterized membrane protein